MESGPYDDPAANVIYQLLFCDRPEMFAESGVGDLPDDLASLYSDHPDLEAAARIAADVDHESRARMLACNLLRSKGREVPEKELFGTIVEVALGEGLDTLAAYADRGIRYINHTGKMVIVEGTPHPFEAEVEEVLAASRTIVEAIGPWDKERLPPPAEGNIRMSFLVSDGLYFGEGPFEAMEQDRLSAPVVDSVTKLFLKVVDLSVDGRSH